MSEIDKYQILIVLLGVLGVSSIIMHIQSYKMLYFSLKKRGLAGDDLAPDWISKISSYGCMGYISRIKKDIGIAKLNDIESSRLRKTVVYYTLGTGATFIAVCILFWRSYGAPN